MLKIGLTGSIGTGKSTVSKLLRERGIPVIDADLLAREIVKKGQECLIDLKNVFGNQILTLDGELDRKKLGQIVFSDDSKLELLNSVTHPHIRRKMKNQMNELEIKNNKVIVLDVPLLFEAQMEDLVDLVLVIFVKEEIQVKRIMERDNCTQEEAMRIIKTQISQQDKISKSDYTIDNSGTIEELKEKLNGFLEKIEENK